MTTTDLLASLVIVLGFATLRFGVPLLITWLFKLFCCRVLHLQPEPEPIGLE